MPIIKWEPFNSFVDLEKQFIDLLKPLDRANCFTPPLDIYRDGDKLVVETDLPKIDPKNVSVSIENDVLTINGESQQKREIDEKNFYRKEVQRGSFYRSVPLPAKVVGDQAEANYENGLLKITIPMAEEKKAKKIKINLKT